VLRITYLGESLVVGVVRVYVESVFVIVCEFGRRKARERDDK